MMFFYKKHFPSLRQERGNCRICWTAAADDDFRVSSDKDSSGFIKGSMCCGYGADGMISIGYDCVQIPGALKAAMTSMMGPSQICGRAKGGLVSVSGMTAVTICCELSLFVLINLTLLYFIYVPISFPAKKQPFSIRFLTDQWEFLPESAKVNSGFRLTYIQNAQNC